jgi:hypothetical protein
MAWMQSLTWPPVTRKSTDIPSSLASKWIFVVRPPRERPRALSVPLFYAPWPPAGGLARWSNRSSDKRPHTYRTTNQTTNAKSICQYRLVVPRSIQVPTEFYGNPEVDSQLVITDVNEKAGLKQDALSSQVIDAPETRRPAMKSLPPR